MYMRIEQGQMICGFPAIEIRGLLRSMEDYMVITQDFIARQMNIVSNDADKLLRQLVAQEYLVRAPGVSENYDLTIKGNALRMASAAKPIHRSTADRVVSEFLRRVEELNSNPEYLLYVGKVVVFGSYLTAAERLGDIDLVIDLQVKPQYRENIVEASLDRANEAITRGRHFSSFEDRLFWPHTEVHRFLKNRVKSLSLHAIDDGVLQLTHTKVLYEFPVSAAS